MKSPTPTYRISGDGKSITCLACKMTSYNRADIENLYCGKCHVFHSERATAPGKKLKITLTMQIDGQQGMDQFARMLKVLRDGGFHGQVRRLVAILVTAARTHGAIVPPEIEAMTDEGESPIPIPTRAQALEQARRSPGFPGICAQCGCTESNACTDQGLLGDETCAWANTDRTLCTNPACIEKAGPSANKKSGATAIKAQP